MELTFDSSLTELNKLSNYLNSIRPLSSNLFDKKVGLHRIFNNIVNALNTLKELDRQKCETQSFATLSRMIIDNYSVFYLLTSHSSQSEQKLRYYLYLLDSFSGRINSITSFSESVKNNSQIKDFETPEEVIAHDKRVISNLMSKIEQENLKELVTDKIIAQKNWKFNLENGTRFSWEDLYNLSRIANHFSKLIQNIYSSYTHGLAMTILYEKRNESFIESTKLMLATINLSIAKIALRIFSIDKDNAGLDLNFVILMECHWSYSEKLNRE